MHLQPNWRGRLGNDKKRPPPALSPSSLWRCQWIEVLSFAVVFLDWIACILKWFTLKMRWPTETPLFMSWKLSLKPGIRQSSLFRLLYTSLAHSSILYPQLSHSCDPWLNFSVNNHFSNEGTALHVPQTFGLVLQCFVMASLAARCYHHLQIQLRHRTCRIYCAFNDILSEESSSDSKMTEWQ